MARQRLRYYSTVSPTCSSVLIVRDRVQYQNHLEDSHCRTGFVCGHRYFFGSVTSVSLFYFRCQVQLYGVFSPKVNSCYERTGTRLGPHVISTYRLKDQLDIVHRVDILTREIGISKIKRPRTGKGKGVGIEETIKSLK